MNQGTLHGIVLGAGFALAVLILVIRGSSSTRAREPEAPAAPVAAQSKPAVAPFSKGAESEEDKALREAEELVNEAHDLWKLAAGKEGREGELIQAKKLLKSAQELLSPLSRDSERVKALSARLGGLLDDVVRVSGF